MAWTVLIGLRIGTIQVVGSCEHSNESSVSIKFGGISCISDEFLPSQGLCSMQLISWGKGSPLGKGSPMLKCSQVSSITRMDAEGKAGIRSGVVVVAVPLT